MKTLFILGALCLITAGSSGSLLAAPEPDTSLDLTTRIEGEASEEHEEDHHGEEGHGKEGHGKHSSRFPDDPIPLDLEDFPARPKPIIELGEPFLGTGTLKPGFRLPTGAVWQPALLSFGTFRTAFQTFEPDAQGGTDARISEWTSRLDLFFNLQLSGSERLVVSFRTFDEGGRFTSYFFEHPDPGLDGEFRDELDAEIETLFFEGDFGEIFPNLDWDDFGSTDIGFSIGRQPMFFQEGMLLNDTIDGIGLTRNTLLPKGTSNFRMTFFYGWDNIHSGGVERQGADLFAFLTSTDFRRTTMDIDVAYVHSDARLDDLFNPLRLKTEQIVVGISGVQRFGKVNSSLRLLGSLRETKLTEEAPFDPLFPFDQEIRTEGALFLSELSWTPPYSHDLVYVNTFWAIDRYIPAAQGPAVGGPLGRAGINFAAVGLGSYGAPLSSVARDAVGGAVGYQKFFNHTRRQLIVEAAARLGTRSSELDAYAVTARFQNALGRRFVVVVDGFVSYLEAPEFSFLNLDDRTPYGGRLELVVKF